MHYTSICGRTKFLILKFLKLIFKMNLNNNYLNFEFSPFFEILNVSVFPKIIIPCLARDNITLTLSASFKKPILPSLFDRTKLIITISASSP